MRNGNVIDQRTRTGEIGEDLELRLVHVEVVILPGDVYQLPGLSYGFVALQEGQANINHRVIELRNIAESSGNRFSVLIHFFVAETECIVIVCRYSEEYAATMTGRKRNAGRTWELGRCGERSEMLLKLLGGVRRKLRSQTGCALQSDVGVITAAVDLYRASEDSDRKSVV